MKVSRSIFVDEKALAFAKKYGIKEQDLIRGYMNAYEYQLQKEFIEQLSDVTELYDTYHGTGDYELILDAAGEGIALGVEANQKKEPVIATRLADFGWQVLGVAWEILEIKRGIDEGIVLGAYRTGRFVKNLAFHPYNTTREMIYGFGAIVYATSKLVSIPIRLGGLCVTGNVEQAGEEWQILCDQTAFLMRECAKKIKETPNREIAKQVTAFAVEWVLTGKVFAFAHRLSSRAGPLFVKMAEAAKKEPRLEHAILTVNGTILQVSETAQKVGGTAKTTVGKAVQKVGGVVKEIAKEANTWKSKGGLIYGPDKKFGSRINHVLQHTVPNINKPKHTVFTVTGEALFDLIDFAWLKRGTPLPNDPGVFVVELDKVIGTLGEKAIRIVTDPPGTSNIITAYPIKV